MLSADLVLKGLGGLAVVGGATTVGVCYQQEKWIFAKKKVETLNLEELAGKVGLSCTKDQTPTETNGVVCSKKTDANVKVKVKRDSDSFDVSNLPATGGSGGKLKVYKTSADETYNNDFKFVIEEADISGDNSKKLEEFETYEIKKEGEDDWRLTRKDKALVLKGKLLGLSGISNCKLPEEGNEITCSNLTAEDLKKIKFDGKKEDGTVTIDNGSQQEAATTITLKISKTTDAPFNEGGYKFVLETNKNISIPKSSGTINIKKGTNTEFKLKATPKSGSPKTLTLEKAWSAEKLGEKVGLKCTAAPNKECTLEASKVSVKNDDTNKFSELSKKEENGDGKKVKYDEDQEGHNQGFRFYAEQEICLKDKSNASDNNKKIEAKGSSPETYYEVKKDTAGTWYLTKKTTAK